MKKLILSALLFVVLIAMVRVVTQARRHHENAETTIAQSTNADPNVQVVSAILDDVQVPTSKVGAAPVAVTSNFAPILTRFMQLDAKPILGRKEQAEFDQILRDPQNIQSAGETIASNAPTESRMHAIVFLAEAARNPDAKANAEVAIQSAFNSPTILKGMALEDKKSHAADKIELYSVLSRSNPILAAQLKSETSSHLLLKLIQFTEGFYLKGGKS